MLTALASLNDQVFVRLALPVDTRELVVVSGYAGFIYARTADANANLVRAYDQETVGAILSVQFGLLPLAGSLDYNFVDQHGGPGVLIAVLDLQAPRVHAAPHRRAGVRSGTPPLSEGGRLMMPESAVNAARGQGDVDHVTGEGIGKSCAAFVRLMIDG